MKKRYAIPLGIAGGFIAMCGFAQSSIYKMEQDCHVKNQCMEVARLYTNDMGDIQEWMRNEPLRAYPPFQRAVAKIQAEYAEARAERAAREAKAKAAAEAKAAQEKAAAEAKAAKEARYEAKGLYKGITKGIKVNKGEEENYANCLEARKMEIDLGRDPMNYDCDKVATWVDPIEKRVAWEKRNGGVMGMTWKCERQIIKPQLKDPGSYQHIRSEVAGYEPQKDQGVIEVSYRAKNSFGGYVVSQTPCVF